MSESATKLWTKFAEENRLCVLSVIGEDNFPHSAVMHYSFHSNKHQLIFSTDRTSEKFERFKSSNKSSVAIGWSETDWITVQMRGYLNLLSDKNLKEYKQIHYAIHPNSQKFENDPKTVFLVFEPEWVKYSDLGVVPETIHTFQNNCHLLDKK